MTVISLPAEVRERNLPDFCTNAQPLHYCSANCFTTLATPLKIKCYIRGSQ